MKPGIHNSVVVGRELDNKYNYRNANQKRVHVTICSIKHIQGFALLNDDYCKSGIYDLDKQHEKCHLFLSLATFEELQV